MRQRTGLKFSHIINCKEDIMAGLIRFNPIEDRFEDLVRTFFQPVPSTASNGQGAQIKVDVSEDEKSYLVQAEIPGVKKDDIQIIIEGNQVSIAAEVKREQELKEGNRVLRSERYYGKTYRTFVLAQEVDDNASEAKYLDGVLELRLPKKAAQSARKLTIQ